MVSSRFNRGVYGEILRQEIKATAFAVFESIHILKILRPDVETFDVVLEYLARYNTKNIRIDGEGPHL